MCAICTQYQCLCWMECETSPKQTNMRSWYISSLVLLFCRCHQPLSIQHMCITDAHKMCGPRSHSWQHTGLAVAVRTANLFLVQSFCSYFLHFSWHAPSCKMQYPYSVKWVMIGLFISFMSCFQISQHPLHRVISCHVGMEPTVRWPVVSRSVLVTWSAPRTLHLSLCVVQMVRHTGQSANYVSLPAVFSAIFKYSTMAPAQVSLPLLSHLYTVEHMKRTTCVKKHSHRLHIIYCIDIFHCRFSNAEHSKHRLVYMQIIGAAVTSITCYIVLHFSCKAYFINFISTE